ncbi:MAG: hypothetical protein ACI9WS_001510 [Paraglaciecola psychrophila]|jgi:hypothetical protein
MPLQLRQICLVAGELEPVLRDLTAILGIERCFVDPGVAHFGLENTLLPIGRNFLEVVSPIQQDTAAGRYLDRRGGDGGYMVITQADSAQTQRAIRQNALDNGVRIAYESTRDDWNLCQLHPADLQAGFFEIESDAHCDFEGHWHPAGGSGWEHKVKQDVTTQLLGVELQGPDPMALATLWAAVAGVAVQRRGDEYWLQLNNAELRFVLARDGRGAGLSGLDIAVADRAGILLSAKQRGCYVSDQQLEIGGVQWYLSD